MLNSNQPIKVAHLQKLADQFNVEQHICDSNGKQFYQ